MATTYSSPKIARELSRKFGNHVKTVKVEMKFTREIGRFVQRVEAAHQRTASSKLVFN